MALFLASGQGQRMATHGFVCGIRQGRKARQGVTNLPHGQMSVILISWVAKLISLSSLLPLKIYCQHGKPPIRQPGTSLNPQLGYLQVLNRARHNSPPELAENGKQRFSASFQAVWEFQRVWVENRDSY